MKKLIALMTLSFVTVGSAHAVMHVNLLGGASFAKDSTNPETAGTTTSAKLGLTYGATAEFDMGSLLSLEAGVLSVGNKSKATTSAGDLTISVRALEFPVLVRFTALPILDFGIGGYYAKIPDTYKVEDSTIALLPNGTYTSTTSSSDYGLRGSARVKLPLAPLIRFLIDVNYDFGLKDLDSSSTTKKHRAYGALAGISFGF